MAFVACEENAKLALLSIRALIEFIFLCRT
jgi:hypothetical protein